MTEAGLYNHGKRKNHKKAKGRIPSAEREEEAWKGQDKKGEEGIASLSKQKSRVNLTLLFFD